MSKATARLREWKDASRRSQTAFNKGAKLVRSGEAIPRELIAEIAKLDGEVERRLDAFAQTQYDKDEQSDPPK